jgi:hypothetical protein
MSPFDRIPPCGADTLVVTLIPDGGKFQVLLGQLDGPDIVPDDTGNHCGKFSAVTVKLYPFCVKCEYIVSGLPPGAVTSAEILYVGCTPHMYLKLMVGGVV